MLFVLLTHGSISVNNRPIFNLKKVLESSGRWALRKIIQTCYFNFSIGPKIITLFALPSQESTGRLTWK